MEWFEWAFVVPIVGWIIREVWADIARGNAIKKQAITEHEYYQKRLVFSHKNEFYRDVYHKLRQYQGGLSAFESSSIERTLTTFQRDAKENHIEFLSGSGAKADDIERFELKYMTNELSRIDANYDMVRQKIEDSRNDLNNYLSINKFMLNVEEDKIIRKFYELSRQMEVFISKSETIFESKDPKKKFQRLTNHFHGLYTDACIELNNLVDDFEKCIKKALF